MFKPGAPPRMTSRAFSRHGRAPVGLGVRALAAQGYRRPRHTPPHAPHPETPRSSPGASRTAPRRTGLELTTDRRSVGGTPLYARRPREPCYGEHLAPSPLRHWSERAYKNRPVPFPRAPPPSSIPPLPAAGELASPPLLQCTQSF
jgi:hypothetical protein